MKFNKKIMASITFQGLQGVPGLSRIVGEDLENWGFIIVRIPKDVTEKEGITEGEFV